MPLVATLLCACGPSGSSFEIEGSFENMTGSELYIYNLSDKYACFDTITVANGEFLYRGECDRVTPYLLVFPNAVEQVIFVAPGKSISYEVSSNDLKNYVVKGTEENKVMNEFRKATDGQTAKQVQQTAKNFISEHSGSLVAIYLFDRYFVQPKDVNYKQISEILAILKKAQPKNEYLLNVEGKLNVLQKSMIGKVIPDVTLYGKNRKKSNLWKGHDDEVTLIYFWSSWGNGSMDFIWKARNLRRKQNNDDNVKGRIVGINLDEEYFRFENECNNDSANKIEQYSEGIAFESKVLNSIGVPYVPYYIITDKNHKVVAAGADANELEKSLDKLMK